jgi:hypothetical protein
MIQVKKNYLTLVALTIALSACSNTMTMSSTDQIISGIYTASLPTLDAQMQMPVSTSTSLPVFTATSISTLVPPTAAPILIPPTNAPVPVYSQRSNFSQNSSASTEVDSSVCNKSAYIDDITIPDGTILAPDEAFVKTWELKNTGYCTWKAESSLMFFMGDSMSGQDTEIRKTLASGNQAKFSIELTAPNAEGTYTGYWILTDKYGYPFGTPFFVQIVVKNQ